MTPWWRLQAGFTTLWKDLHEKDGHVDLAPRNSLGNDPNWQIVGRSDFNLAPQLQLSLNARAVGDIEQDPEIGSYVEAGGQLAYELDNDVEMIVAGRNLLRQTHAESNDPEAGQLAKRSIYAGARARF